MGAPSVVPQVLSGAVFLTRVILLISGATPEIHSRLAWLGDILRLGVIELSDFIGSLAGAGILVLAWGLWHRLDAAYGLAVTLLGIDAGASLLKGVDWEEASALTVVLAVLIPARRHFHWKAALSAESFELGSGWPWVIRPVTRRSRRSWSGRFESWPPSR